MKVKDIQVDGFGVWSGLSVDSVPESMTLFYGPNEAGKTTLMQFLRTMFYGFTAERRGRYLPPVYGGTPGGAMRVTGPGGGYEIRRHAQLTDSGVTGQLSVTGQDGLSQGQHRLSMLLGQIDEQIFTNVFAIGIRELQELSTLDDTSAADELYKLSSGLDRVSLVDVLRTLRRGRQQLIGKRAGSDDSDVALLISLGGKRERLRDEVEQLTRGGRRWSELASQRRAQDSEIQQLTERIAKWANETRCVEIASSVYDAWREREQVQQQIADDDRRTQLPEDAPGQLVQIDALMEERRAKLEEIKAKRRELRDRNEELPLNRRLLDRQSKIEAASEQATWIEALQEQILRLDQQIERAKAQLMADAEKLGLDDEEREALSGRGSSELPDLSKQTLTALVGPAKDVKANLFVLRQAREEARQQQTLADKAGAKLAGTLQAARSNNLHDAMRQQTDTIVTLRSRIQLEQHLEKLRRQHRDLEKEALELATSEAYPLEQRILLFVPFLFGGLGTVYGMVHVMGWSWFFEDPNPTWGMSMVFLGMLSFFFWYFVRERGYTGTSLDLEDCERQIESVRRQIREAEAEAEGLDSRLPPGSGTLEMRLREAEQLHTELEASMPTYHAQQAALQAAKNCRARAAEAAEGYKAAKRAWTSMLSRLGLSESMSPSGIRQLSENYEAVQASRRRLEELEAERDSRRREQSVLARRIDSLYVEALGSDRETAYAAADDDRPIARSAKSTGNHDSARDRERGRDGNRERSGRERASRDQTERGEPNRRERHDRERERQERGDTAATDQPPNRLRRRVDPLEQLHELQEALASQHHWIKRRQELRGQDQQLKKAHIACLRTVERCEQQRRNLWAQCGVATAEQFYEMVDVRTRLVELRSKQAELDKQIRSIIGNHVEYAEVQAALDGASEADLQRRYESLVQRSEETQERIALLRTSQGELSQEMKQLGEDDRLAIAQLELGCVERQIDSVVRRWQTLSMASALLEDVCATFERERQPETLREASSFLRQLTDGKYTRVWTPLGTNKLKVDSHDGQSLELDLLSRGTREAVFIALRLSLAAAYARRGVMLPLILDDVLVNFDRNRALYAARTLKTFAELGHQVLMFTCHKHIAEIFQEIDVQVRQLPPQGVAGRAMIMEPEPVAKLPPPQPVVAEAEAEFDDDQDEPLDEPPPLLDEPAPAPPELVQIELPVPTPKPTPIAKPLPIVEAEPEPQDDELDEPAIGWNWYERDQQDEWAEPQEEPTPPPGTEGIWQRNVTWASPAPVVTPK